uniref:Reverse transcriptase domain-containing protein n=1 Tax=Cannabis sativa TaxID=3483 RepID=A0A803PH86_CANSA
MLTSSISSSSSSNSSGHHDHLQPLCFPTHLLDPSQCHGGAAFMAMDTQRPPFKSLRPTNKTVTRKNQQTSGVGQLATMGNDQRELMKRTRSQPQHKVVDVASSEEAERVVKEASKIICMFVEVDPKNRNGLWRDYLRVHVTVNIDVPLKRRMRMKKMGGDCNRPMTEDGGSGCRPMKRDDSKRRRPNEVENVDGGPFDMEAEVVMMTTGNGLSKNGLEDVVERLCVALGFDGLFTVDAYGRSGRCFLIMVEWRSQFGKLDSLIRDLERRLDIIQRLPVGSREWTTERALRNSLNEARVRKEVYWKLRARVSWLKEGDKCSKFFFLSASIKGRRNAIECILNRENAWISKRELIGNEFMEFFQGIFSGSEFGSNPNCSELVKECLSSDDQAELIRKPSPEEIKNTLFVMSSSKAPGPDGMSVLFFKHYWDSVGGDFCEAVLDFFHTGRMHKGVNATNIVLIPKVQNPKRPNHFRPISLCNVVYKVISKIIANRIKPLLPKLICPTQAAFVPGRNIHDNNVIAQEIVHSFNRKKGREGLFAIKIDLMKAYDRMSWGFIDHVLACFGVPQEFRAWGDPLSPYLFIWAAEILSRILENAQYEGIIQGIRLSRGGPIMSHIFFADDLILVGRANVEEAKGVWGCLDQFCSWSGQKVNTMKSSIFFSKNTLNVVKQRIRELLGLRSPEGNVNYLGLPLFRSRQKDADFNFILDKLTSKLHGWKAKSLSKAGRATLIKSVGLSLPLYAMQTTKLSNKLAAKIDGLVRDFWWGSEKGNHSLHLKAWDKLCLPKSLGGLGFRKSKEMNQAFLAKWEWNLLTGQQSLCCRILEAKYLKGKSFLDCEPKASDSWFWKNVSKTRAIIRKGAHSLVADGTALTSGWILGLATQRIYPHPIGRDMNTGDEVMVAFSCKSAYMALCCGYNESLRGCPSLGTSSSEKFRERLKITMLPCSLAPSSRQVGFGVPPKIGQAQPRHRMGLDCMKALRGCKGSCLQGDPVATKPTFLMFSVGKQPCRLALEEAKARGVNSYCGE